MDGRDPARDSPCAATFRDVGARDLHKTNHRQRGAIPLSAATTTEAHGGPAGSVAARTPAAQTAHVPQHQLTIWWKTAGAVPSTARLERDVKADVAIVGAGFTGLTAAWHLARQGARVVVLEAQTVGSGASGVNAGFVVPNFARADPASVIARMDRERGGRLLDMVGQGADRVFGTIRDNAIDCDAAQFGWMHVAHSPAMLDVLAARAEAWQRLGHAVRMLDENAARALTGARHCHGALLDPRGGTLHPLNYAYGLARLATGAGALIHEHAPVGAIAPNGNTWVVQSGDWKVSADKVLLCTNAADVGIARRMNRTIVPLRVYQLATQPLPRNVVHRISPGRHPVADTRANLFTYRLDRDDRLISGGMPMLPIGARNRMARMIAGRLQHELGLPDAPALDCIWHGTAAMTTDFLPHLYEFGPGFIGGIGCNGRGVALTAMLGEVLADAALGRAWDDLPIPKASAQAIPLRTFAEAAPSLAIAQARWQDWSQGL